MATTKEFKFLWTKKTRVRPAASDENIDQSSFMGNVLTTKHFASELLREKMNIVLFVPCKPLQFKLRIKMLDLI